MQNITTTPPVDLTPWYKARSQNISFRVEIDSDGTGTFVTLPNVKAVEFTQNAFYPFVYDWEEKISTGKIIFTNKDQQYGNFFATGGYSDYFIKRRLIKVYQSIYYNNPPTLNHEFLLFTCIFDSAEYASIDTVVINILGLEAKLKETILKDEGLLSMVFSVTTVKNYEIPLSTYFFTGIAYVLNSARDKINPNLYSFYYDGTKAWIAFDKTITQGSYRVYCTRKTGVKSRIELIFTLSGLSSSLVNFSGTDPDILKPYFSGKNSLRAIFELCQMAKKVLYVKYDGNFIFNDLPSGASVFEFKTDTTGLPSFRPSIDDSERYDKIVINGSNSEYNSFFDLENATAIATSTGSILKAEFEKTVEITIPDSIRAESIRIEGVVSGTERPTTAQLVGYQPGYQIKNDETYLIDTPLGTGLILNDTDPLNYSNLYIDNLITSIDNSSGSLDSGSLTLGFASAGSAWSSGTITFARTKKFYRITPETMSLNKNVKGTWTLGTVYYSTDGGANYSTATENTHFTVSKGANDFIISPIDHDLSASAVTAITGTAVSNASFLTGATLAVTGDEALIPFTMETSEPYDYGNQYYIEALKTDGSGYYDSFASFLMQTETFLQTATLTKTTGSASVISNPSTASILGISGTPITHLQFSVSFQPESRSNSSITFTMPSTAPSTAEDSEVIFRNFAITGTGGGTLTLNDVQMFVNRRTISSGPPENFVYELTVSLLEERANTAWQFTCDWVKLGDIIVEIYTATGEIRGLIKHTKETEENYYYQIYGNYVPANLDFSLIGIQNNKVFVKVTHNQGFDDSYSISVYGKELYEYSKEVIEDEDDSGDADNKKTLEINNQYIETAVIATDLMSTYLKSDVQKTIEFDKVGGLLPLEICDKITVDPQGIYQSVSAMPLERYIRRIRWYMEYSENAGMFSEQKILAKEF